MNLLSKRAFEADLQLRDEVVERCRAQVARHAALRSGARTQEDWEELGRPLLAAIRAGFPRFLFDRPRLVPRTVSKMELDDFRLENVLFESYPGWEVNASVYLPKRPGRYPCVVCPTGHSTKTGESYQVSAQTFARNGYIAVSFDPPGARGELAHLNNHFTNGLIGYLTGIWSNSHFVLDALACLDYLETRDDADLSRGAAMTGVSGGGMTTIYASLLDERITFLAPVCCLNEHEEIHFKNLYTSCPEQFAPGFIERGIDFADLVALQAPKPCLIAAGKQDGLFDYRNTLRLYHDASDVYRLYGAEDELGMFLQDCGHAYTAEMAVAVVERMNRIFQPGTEAVRLSREELVVLDPELLRCRPSNDVNMFTINKEEGRRLKRLRSANAGDGVGTKAHEVSVEQLREAARQALGLEMGDVPSGASTSCLGKVTVEKHRPIGPWLFEAVTLQLNAAGYVPGIVFHHAAKPTDSSAEKHPALLMIDEEGKWSGFAHSGVLTDLHDTIVYSIDVSGVGELKPRPSFYDATWYGDIERILTYMSVASGRPIMGLRVRDALYALQYLRSRPEVDPERITLAGKGVGATVALLASLFAGRLHKLVLWDSLLNYQALTEDFPFRWPQSVVVPNVLQRFDLQDVLRHAPCGTKVVLNPLDAGRNIVDLALAKTIYPEDAVLRAESAAGDARRAFVNAVLAKEQ